MDKTLYEKALERAISYVEAENEFGIWDDEAINAWALDQFRKDLTTILEEKIGDFPISAEQLLENIDSDDQNNAIGAADANGDLEIYYDEILADAKNLVSGSGELG